MIDAAAFRRLALSFEGATEAPHVDRTAFRVARNFATLASDGLSANLKLSPDEQEHLCALHPEGFAPVSGGWGRQGWTTARLSALDETALRHALETAWRHALPGKRPE